jgi:hypothetical protein
MTIDPLATRRSDAQACLQRLEEPHAWAGAPAYWTEAMAAMPQGSLPFLGGETLSARRMVAELAEDAEAPLQAVAAEIAADPDLTALAWYLHWRVFVAFEYGQPWGAPTLQTRLGDLAGAFYQLLSLAFPEALAQVHRHRGYPAEVTAETIQQLASYDGNHRRAFGRPGVFARQFPWLATYLMDPYVRLGRLEYQLHGYGGGAHVWRRERDGAVLALAEDGVRVHADGLRLQPEAPAAQGWTAHYAEDETAVTGHPIDPRGFIRPATVRLARGEWVSCLQRGDTVLDLHIPAGGAMTWEACVESFRRAQEFFPRYHADAPFTALVVSTWFMDPRLADLLPAGANPLRLQRATYMIPTIPDPGGPWFVFLRALDDPAALPRDTSLRRALADFLASGRTWHGGGMFLMRAEMAAPREGCYRDSFTVLGRELGFA